ncbi:MAG: MlrC C-terminal domain-containing protein, partial [Mycobacteriales bacterium]
TSLRQLRSLGIEPSAYRVVVAKGVNAPRAAYGSIARRMLAVDTPGVHTRDLTALDYRHRHTPMFPFEPATRWPV